MHGLADWLVDAKLVSPSDVRRLQQDGQTTGLLLAAALIAEQKLDEKTLVTLLSQRLGVPAAPGRLYKQSISHKILSLVPEDLCWQHRLFPFDLDRTDGRLHLAMMDPTDEEALGAIRSIVGHRPKVFVIGPLQLDKAVRKHYMDSWVDETGKRRFFGYSDITNPGVKPKAGGAVPAKPPLGLPAFAKPPERRQPTTALPPEPVLPPEPALSPKPALSPEPTLPPESADFSDGDPVQRTATEPLATTPTPPTPGLSREPTEAIASGIMGRPPAPAAPAAPIARIAIGDDRAAIRQRLLLLEDTIGDLLDALARSQDETLAAAASAIRQQLRDVLGS